MITYHEACSTTESQFVRQNWSTSCQSFFNYLFFDTEKQIDRGKKTESDPPTQRENSLASHQTTRRWWIPHQFVHRNVREEAPETEERKIRSSQWDGKVSNTVANNARRFTAFSSLLPRNFVCKIVKNPRTSDGSSKNLEESAQLRWQSDGSSGVSHPPFIPLTSIHTKEDMPNPITYLDGAPIS